MFMCMDGASRVQAKLLFFANSKIFHLLDFEPLCDDRNIDLVACQLRFLYTILETLFRYTCVQNYDST